MALRNDHRHGFPPRTHCGKRTDSQVKRAPWAHESFPGKYNLGRTQMFLQQLGSYVCTGWGSEDRLCLLHHLVWAYKKERGDSTEATLWVALPTLHSQAEGSQAEGHSVAGQVIAVGA